MSELLLKEEGWGNVLAVKHTGCTPKIPEWIQNSRITFPFASLLKIKLA